MPAHMKWNSLFRRYACLLVALAMIIPVARSQNYRFKPLSSKGLASKFIYTINQDRNGFLWLGTGEGLSRFDGLKFTDKFTTDSIHKALVKISYTDRKGNIWFGYDDGYLMQFTGRHFMQFKPKKEDFGSVNAITEDAEGNIYAVSQNNGIEKINIADNKVIPSSATLNDMLVYAAATGDNGEYLLGTGNGLFLFRQVTSNNSFEKIGQITGVPLTKIQCIFKVHGKDQYYLGTEDAGVYVLEGKGFDVKKYSATPLSAAKGLADARVQSIFDDVQGNLWISTMGAGLFELIPDKNGKGFREIQNFTKVNGLGSDNVNVVFQDREGIMWIGTFGDGLSSLTAGGFLFFDPFRQQSSSNINAICSSGDYLWLGTDKGLLRVNRKNTSETVLINRKNGLPDDAVSSLYDDGKYLWVGTAENGIYRIANGSTSPSRFFYSVNLLENVINCLDGDGKALYAATNNGIIRFDLKNGERKIFNMTEGGLTYNRILDIFTDEHKQVWFATKGNGLYTITADGLGKEQRLLKINTEVEFTCLTEDKAGNFWAGTNGSGVVKFQNDSVYLFNTDRGLLSNYCYSIGCGSDGSIWVGHSNGISRINTENNVLVTYGSDNGITGELNQNALYTENSGMVYFGTSDGLVEFDYAREYAQKVPPALNLVSVKIDDQEHDFSRDIVLPYDRHKIQIDFIGIYLKDPERVIYRYRLDGYGKDTSWRETSERSALFPEVRDGHYTFMLKACSSEGYCVTQPIELHIRVKLPFWKTWWFVLSSIAALALAVIGIIKDKERRHILYERKLEKELAERTKEVISQKEEIEIKNRDITDSINYAQRIQQSILPSMKRLQEKFSGSFIYYQPRDIVSGDFYWFDMVSPDKFMIVCADSTGHGVPGAFMSMIGTTLIKDICIRGDLYSPGDILRMLDNELMGTLNQNMEAERSNDGMDIIVCEIDIKSYQVRVASAMRPLIFYRNGEQIYIPGSKNSVGGVFDEKEAKVFEESTYYLAKGDLIYMFSDGYPDQFGGPMGKKFKMVRLRNLLQHIYTKPMDEQYQHVKNNFHLWRGNYEQVDDVLFLGIKL